MRNKLLLGIGLGLGLGCGEAPTGSLNKPTCTEDPVEISRAALDLIQSSCRQKYTELTCLRITCTVPNSNPNEMPQEYFARQTGGYYSLCKAAERGDSMSVEEQINFEIFGNEEFPGIADSIEKCISQQGEITRIQAGISSKAYEPSNVPDLDFCPDFCLTKE